MLTEDRRRNSRAANCCKCGTFIEAGHGWLYQDTQSRQACRDFGFKKHWKVKCDQCHSGIERQEPVKKLSVAAAKKLIAQHGSRFATATVAEWGNQKAITFDGNPLENFVLSEYHWVSPEQFVLLAIGEEMLDTDMTPNAYSLLEAFCLELDAKREAQ